jgi:glycerate kinase
VHVVVAPDSFKGSLTAEEAARAIRRGILLADRGATIRCVPLSDGGEGFASVLVDARGGVLRETLVTGPLGDPTQATWALVGDGRTAVVETAQAIGLHLVRPPVTPPAHRTRARASRRPLETTTTGVGELVRAALDEGATTVALGLGGSATTDGGAGAAAALGVTFRGTPAPLRGGRLEEVLSIDMSSRDARLASTELLGLTDVDNPLTGPNGASQVYGPQKGASREDVAALDGALAHLASVAGDPGTSPGDGAAGGLGYGLRVFLGARLRSGIDFVLDQVGFDAALEGADLVITGEGRIDGQTTRGKVVAGVTARAAARGVPVIALAGSAGPGAESVLTRGLGAYFTLAGPNTSERDAMMHAAPLLEALAHRVIRARKA